MTSEELGTFIFDLLSEATQVVESVLVKETLSGPVLIVGLRNGTLHHVAVTSPSAD